MHFSHSRRYRKGELVTEDPAVIGDLKRLGLVTTKAAQTPDNKMAPEASNKAKAK